MSLFSSSSWRARIVQARVQGKEFLAYARNSIWSIRTLVSVCGILLLLVMFTAAIMPVRYDISVGMVPTHTITANRDVIDEITTEQLRKSAEAGVQPTYHYSDGVAEAVLNQFDLIFAQLNTAIQYSQTLENVSSTRRYTTEELNYARTIITDLDLRDHQLRTLLNTTPDDLATLYSTLNIALQNALSGNIIEGAESQAVKSILEIVGYAYREKMSLLQNVAQPLLSAVIKPNMIIDQEATAAARQSARDSVEPIVYKQGQNILVKGEGRVERYQYEMLSNLGLLHSTNVDISIYLGGAMIVVIVMSCALILLRLTDKTIVHDYKWLMLLLTITALTLICCILARLVNIYLAPVVLGAMLICATIGIRPSFILNAALAILVSALAAGGSSTYASEMVQVLACSLCSGSLVIILLSKHTSRLRIIGASIAAALCNYLIMLAIGLMTSSTAAIVTSNALWSMGSALLSGLLCITLQPLLEALFNLPTPTKLMELSNPNHPLLRRLLLEAPGTYHHSIVVANLAEAAAEAIGANPLLARVGGYYHDVGKLRRPLYFKENQLGSANKLDETDPYTSAQIVISHTRDGVTLARNYHLPREVIKIISEHHGNTPVMYFYTQAVKEADGQNVDIADYRYDAHPPATKEGAIVLLCDTIEAAVRSMSNPTPSAIEDFIVKLIRGKLQDGQLSQSPLTLKDIDVICHASATVLNGVFHERIEYPDMPIVTKSTKSDAAATATVASVSELTKPWDGLSVEDVPKRYDAEAVEPELSPQNEDALANEEIKSILVDPSEFEPEQPLQLIEPPVSESLLSIDEVLSSAASGDLESTESNAAAKAEEATPKASDEEDISDDEDAPAHNESQSSETEEPEA